MEWYCVCFVETGAGFDPSCRTWISVWTLSISVLDSSTCESYIIRNIPSCSLRQLLTKHTLLFYIHSIKKYFYSSVFFLANGCIYQKAEVRQVSNVMPLWRMSCGYFMNNIWFICQICCFVPTITVPSLYILSITQPPQSSCPASGTEPAMKWRLEHLGSKISPSCFYWVSLKSECKGFHEAYVMFLWSKHNVTLFTVTWWALIQFEKYT